MRSSLMSCGVLCLRAAEERNSYYGVQDACEELLQMTAPLFGEANAAELIEKGAANPHIKADASEASESYLEVIDAVVSAYSF